METEGDQVGRGWGAPPLQTWLQPSGPAVCRSVSGCACLQAGGTIEAEIRPLEA